jgi:hypothetical protein
MWPFGTRMALLAAPLTFVALLVIVGLFRLLTNVPINQDDRSLLFGSALLSLVPIGLAILDVIFQRGAVIEYKGAKLVLSSSVQVTQSSISVPTNIGVPSQPISDSDTTFDTQHTAACCG